MLMSEATTPLTLLLSVTTIPLELAIAVVPSVPTPIKLFSMMSPLLWRIRTAEKELEITLSETSVAALRSSRRSP